MPRALLPEWTTAPVQQKPNPLSGKPDGAVFEAGIHALPQHPPKNFTTDFLTSKTYSMRTKIIGLLIGTYLLTLLPAALLAQDWTLLGNGNASNTTSKLGTTNAVNLRIFTRNLERARFDTNGRFGIGTLTPQATLDVHQATGSQVARFNNNVGQMYIGLYKSNNLKGYIGSYAGAVNDVDFGTASGNSTGKVHLTTLSTPRLTIAAAGHVGIGTTAPAHPLDLVNGNALHAVHVVNTASAAPVDRRGIYVSSILRDGWGAGIEARGGYFGISAQGVGGADGSSVHGIIATAHGTAGVGNRYGIFAEATGGSFNAAGYFTGNVYASAFITTSDRKFKENINPLKNALESLLQLKPASYEFRVSERSSISLPKGRQLGLLADEVKAVFPELVHRAVHPARYGKDRSEVISPEETYEAVNYQGLIPVLIASVQELEARNQAKNEHIHALEERLQKMEAALSALLQENNSATPAAGAYLEHSSPNPGKGRVLIRYSLPPGTSSARLVLTNMKGQVVKTLALDPGGAGQVMMDTAALASGTYTYSLWIGGQQRDSKKLVLAR